MRSLRAGAKSVCTLSHCHLHFNRGNAGMERWERERKREKEGGVEVGVLAMRFLSLYWPGHFLGHLKPRSMPLQKLACLLLHLFSVGNTI